MASVLAMGDTMVEVSLQVADAWESTPDVAASASVVGAGGSAANFAAVASALGLKAVLATEIGSDLFTDLLLEDLTTHGIDMSLIRRRWGANSLCVVAIGLDGDRRFLSYRGAETTPSEAEISDFSRRILKKVPDVDWLHISGFWLQRESTSHLVMDAARLASERGIPISLDPSPQLMERPSPELGTLLELVTVFFPNEYEACAFTGTTDIHSAAQNLSTLRIPVVVMKLGDAGAFLITASGIEPMEARAEQVSDSTGAGDALAAGFIAAHLAGDHLENALMYGSDAAAMAIASVGGHSACSAIATKLRDKYSTHSE